MIKLSQPVQQVIKTLQKAGFEAYAVGGSVRDLLMDRKTAGWDFTTNATPEEILKLFPDSFYDNRFGTVGVKIRAKSARPGGRARDKRKVPALADGPGISDEMVDVYEITPYRKEFGYTNHRHPDQITWGKTLGEDLSRRDFTINAIAFDGKTLVDPFDGQGDIKRQLIRAVGDPNERFAEDALRMLRAIRIAAELGFFIDEETTRGIRQNTQSLTDIPAERTRDELLRLVASPHAADGVVLLKNTGLMHRVLPELERAFATPQKSPMRHHIYDVGTHSVMALKHCPSSDPIVRFATLLHDIGKPKTFRKDTGKLITFYNHEVVGTKLVKDIATRLRFSKKDAAKLITLVRWHQFSVDERQTDSALRRFIRRVGKENLQDILALRIGDRLGGGARETSWRLELFKKRLDEVQKQPFTVADLKVDGYDVMKEFSCQPGPIVGKVLNQLFSEVEEAKLPNAREKLLSRMKELKSSLSS